MDWQPGGEVILVLKLLAGIELGKNYDFKHTLASWAGAS